MYLYPWKRNVFWSILESASLSVCPCMCVSLCVSVHVSVCAPNASLCQSTSMGIKSHLVTVLVNPFPHNDTFWRPWETSLLKTLWEKEKLLIRSNFSFSHRVFKRLYCRHVKNRACLGKKDYKTVSLNTNFHSKLHQDSANCRLDGFYGSLVMLLFTCNIS